MKLFNVLAITLIVIFGISCKKFVSVPPPVATVTQDIVFSDSANASLALTGIYYSQIENSLGTAPNKGLSSYYALTGSVSADEFGLASVFFSIFGSPSFYQNNIPATDGANYNIWNNIYKYLYRTNVCIEEIEKSSNISSTAKSQFIGEAKVLRALFYFNLVNFYGDVPLVLSSDYQINATLPRTPVSLVYAQMVKDLEDAIPMLRDAYITPERARINRQAAKFLLAKVHLYMKNWDKAENVATEVINSGIYSITNDLGMVFKKGSNETVWQIASFQGNESILGNTFIPINNTTKPAYVLSNDLLNSFESTDQRKISWIGKSTAVIGGVPTDFYYPFKYKLRGSGSATTSSEYNIVFRLTEMYLVRAEARLEQGKVTGVSGAEQDLNVVRNRAGLPNTTAATQADMRLALRNERRAELFTEGSNRWFDLKRWETVNTVMTGIAPSKGSTWVATAQLFPIPLTELNSNPFLVQNPGY